MADLKQLAEALVNLTVKEVNELAGILKDEYGIEPAAAAVQRLRTEPDLGDRHHVHPDLRRLAVLGSGARPVLAAGDRLVDAVADRSGTRARCAADGRVATSAQAGGYRPLRSGQPVRQRRLAGLPEGARLGGEHEPTRELP